MSTPPRRRVRRRAPSPEERRRILAEEQGHGHRAVAPPPRPLTAIAAVITALLAAGGLVVFVLARRVEPVDALPYALGVFFGLLVAVVYAVIVSRVLERYGELRTAGTVILRALIVLLAVVGGSLGAVGALTFLNARLDRGEGAIHRAQVVDRAQDSGDEAAFRVEWEPGVEKVLPVPASLVAQIQPRRSILHVRTRPGRFGWRWIEGVADVSAPPVEAAVTSGPAAIPDTSRLEARALLVDALALLRDGRRDEAIAAMRRAIDLDPWNVSAYVSLDTVLSAQKDYDTVVEYWTRLVTLDPGNQDAWFARANARRSRGDTVAALDDAEQSCRLGHQGGCQMAEAMRAAPSR